MQVERSFPFDDELRRIVLAQALRSLAPEQASSLVARLFAYAAAGRCPVKAAEVQEALRRHRLRPADPIATSIRLTTTSVNLGEAA